MDIGIVDFLLCLQVGIHGNYSTNKESYVIFITTDVDLRVVLCSHYKLWAKPGLTLHLFLVVNCRIWFISCFYILRSENLASQAMMSLLMDRLETLVPTSMTVKAKRKSKGEKWGQLGSPLNFFCSFPDTIRVWRPESRTAQPWLKSTRTLGAAD